MLESTKRMKYLISPSSGSGIYRKISNSDHKIITPVPTLGRSATLIKDKDVAEKATIGIRGISDNPYSRAIQDYDKSKHARMSEEEIRKHLIESFKEKRKPKNLKKHTKKKKKKKGK